MCNQRMLLTKAGPQRQKLLLRWKQEGEKKQPTSFHIARHQSNTPKNSFPPSALKPDHLSPENTAPGPNTQVVLISEAHTGAEEAVIHVNTSCHFWPCLGAGKTTTPDQGSSGMPDTAPATCFSFFLTKFISDWLNMYFLLSFQSCLSCCFITASCYSTRSVVFCYSYP